MARDSCTPDLASGTRLASIGIGILGDDARLAATGSRPVVRSAAVLARGSRTRERYQIPGNCLPGKDSQESPGQIPGENRPGKSPGQIPGYVEGKILTYKRATGAQFTNRGSVPALHAPYVLGIGRQPAAGIFNGYKKGRVMRP